jgi:hypothetical protein
MAAGLEMIKSSYAMENNIFSFLRNNVIGLMQKAPPLL